MANVKIEHARAVGYCCKGVKKFVDRYGIDWHRFLTEGIPEEELMLIDDVMAKKAIEYMRSLNG